MKDIRTLIPDIYAMVEEGVVLTDDLLDAFANDVKEAIRASFAPRTAYDDTALRMSSIGKPCDRELYYKEHSLEEGEKLRGSTLIKFAYGHMLEALVVLLVKASGHKVSHQQERVEVNGVPGSSDCSVDGVVVDVKSASSYGMRKFQNNGLLSDDPFGYLGQLSGYHGALTAQYPELDKNVMAFLAIDKTNGELALDIYRVPENKTAERIDQLRKILSQPKPPPRGFDPVPDGKSGNMKLGVNCSYCSFKELCHPGLKTYIYSTGPRYLTKVVREPKVGAASGEDRPDEHSRSEEGF